MWSEMLIRGGGGGEREIISTKLSRILGTSGGGLETNPTMMSFKESAGE